MEIEQILKHNFCKKYAITIFLCIRAQHKLILLDSLPIPSVLSKYHKIISRLKIQFQIYLRQVGEEPFWNTFLSVSVPQLVVQHFLKTSMSLTRIYKLITIGYCWTVHRFLLYRWNTIRFVSKLSLNKTCTRLVKSLSGTSFCQFQSEEDKASVPQLVVQHFEKQDKNIFNCDTQAYHKLILLDFLPILQYRPKTIRSFPYWKFSFKKTFARLAKIPPVTTFCLFQSEEEKASVPQLVT